jgi:hypothetical protein
VVSPGPTDGVTDPRQDYTRRSAASAESHRKPEAGGQDRRAV